MASTTSESLTNWLELPLDIMMNILRRVCVVDILENVEKVCTTWLNICKDHPALWKVFKIDSFPYSNKLPRLRELCKVAVDRSQGQLVDLTFEDFCNAELLQYVADRSSQLRRLELAFSFGDINGTWNEALKKFPLLEELNLYLTDISTEAVETAGLYCPMLKTLKVNRRGKSRCNGISASDNVWIDNEFAKALGDHLSNLRHLELIGCSMMNVGLQFILDGCCRLESLDLRICWLIDLNDELPKRCLEQIKHVKLPGDSLEGCPYLYEYSKPGHVCDEDHFKVLDKEEAKFNSKVSAKFLWRFSEYVILLKRDLYKSPNKFSFVPLD